METVDVLIVGAGPSGLMLAGWLAQSGVRPVVVDRKVGPTDETRAVGVHARSLELWDRMGVAEQMLAEGRVAVGTTIWSRGRRVARVPLGEIGEGLSPYPFVFLLAHNHTERILYDHLRELGGDVQWATELSGLQQDDSGVVATLADGRRVRARYVCACDGGRSTVRKALGIEFAGGTYESTFYVADVTATGNLTAGDVNVAFFDERFLAFFPLKGNDRYRFVGLMPETVAREDAEPEDVLPEARRLMGAEIGDVRWFSTYRVHHRVAERFQVGRVFLVGDAGHVHSPVGAQGMNTGLQDAANLAWKLGEVLNHGADERLLETYELERIPFARSLIKTTDRAFQVVVGKSPPARLTRSVVLPLVMPVAMRLPFFRRFLFETISQIRLAYPDSPLSEGPGAGQRMPWRPNRYKGERADRWSLHILGAEPPEAEPWARRHGMGIANWPDEPPQTVLVRPDGYIGYSSPNFEAGEMEKYLRENVGRPIP